MRFTCIILHALARYLSDKTIDGHYSCSNMDIIIVMCSTGGHRVRCCTDFAWECNESNDLCVLTVWHRWTV